MFGIGMPELILIFVIALLIFGPQELPKLAKNLGRAMAEFKRTSDDLMGQIQHELDTAEADEAKSPEPATEAAPGGHGADQGPPPEAASHPDAGTAAPDAAPTALAGSGSAEAAGAAAGSADAAGGAGAPRPAGTEGEGEASSPAHSQGTPGAA